MKKKCRDGDHRWISFPDPFQTRDLRRCVVCHLVQARVVGQNNWKEIRKK